ITTREQLIDFAYKVKENYPDIKPIVAGSTQGEQWNSWGVFPFILDTAPDYIEMTDALSNSFVLYYKNNDGKVYNLFDTKEPRIWDMILEARKLYQDGIIDPDILSLKDYRNEIANNKAAITTSNDFIPEDTLRIALKKSVPDGEIESVILADISKPGNVLTNYKQWNFQCVAKVSKNKERALQFLNWTSKKENYDLLAYGIEGVHWSPVGDDKYNVLSDKYRWFPYAWVWNPQLDRILASASETEIKYEKWFREESNFVKSVETGFTFDPTNIQNEISQHASIEGKYYPALFNGVVDPETYFEKWKQEDYDNVKNIQNELQKQIDAFLKK
ncbi:MAG: ABC transporter substrate-binding protein, partial [Clostridia bacterium]|nr:ABC transporter substrate-binding protein [Clostridia bacterium]